ncbi:hypothetical protein [Shimia ponticola]|uniref:hypothetical protein n=1 Tax=Shimia ponticola TaxID=2582893 RepID=UPI00164C0E4C|nr:hypothetical protein [Shimia ponticola]
MALIDLRQISEPEEFFLTLGGDANSLAASEVPRIIGNFADAYVALSRQLGTDDFELHVVAFHDGSFRTVFKWISSSTRGLLSELPKSLVVSALTALIMSYLHSEGFEKTVYEDYTVFSRGDDSYLIPNEVLDAVDAIPQPDRVGRPLARLFDRLEQLPEIVSLSLERKNGDEEDPLVYIPRVDFARLRERAEKEEDRRTERQRLDERIVVELVKAVFTDAKRKWDFLIFGKSRSVQITDKDFYDDTLARKHIFGNGDQLVVDLLTTQRLDDEKGVWIDVEYEVVRVHDLIPGGAN